MLRRSLAICIVGYHHIQKLKNGVFEWNTFSKIENKEKKPNQLQFI